MRRHITAITASAALVSTMLFGSINAAEAGACKGAYCGPAAPIKCEKIYLDSQLWEQVRISYWQQGGQRAWWRARSLVCGGNCVTYKKNYTASSYICAPEGSEVCYIDSITGQKHVWRIDGISEPPR